MTLTCSISSRQDRNGNARDVVRFPHKLNSLFELLLTQNHLPPLFLFTTVTSGTTTATTLSSSSSTTSARPTTTGKSWARTATVPTDGPSRPDRRPACSQRADPCTTTSSLKIPAPRWWRRISWRSKRRRSRPTSSRRSHKKRWRGLLWDWR